MREAQAIALEINAKNEERKEVVQKSLTKL